MAHASSIQSFGLNKFPQPHSVGGDTNLGRIIPIMWSDCPFGSVIENNVDFFSRSSPLVDPAFLDCDVSIGHYFVSYEAMDPLFKVRARDFKRLQNDVPLPVYQFPRSKIYNKGSDGSTSLRPQFAPGSLVDLLGLSLPVVYPHGELPADGNETLDLSLYPVIAYHMICDWFFTNHNFQDCYRAQNLMIQLLGGSLGDSVAFDSDQITDSFNEVDTRFDPDNGSDRFDAYQLLDLRYCNFEPDYFTTSRPKPGGPDVYLPGTSENPAAATVRNLMDSELLQKVSDMLYHGGYSYNDFVSILYGIDLGSRDCEEPIFLAGNSVPLQVSTVTQQSIGSEDSPLGAQAGNVVGYASGQNKCHYVATRSGIYMALAWIRPKPYYKTFVDRSLLRKEFGDFVIPQLADASNEPLYQYELSGDIEELMKDEGSRKVFGYMDRYENYRTRVNRAVGTLRTTRQSWLNTRNFDNLKVALYQSPEFLNMEYQVNYTPWVVTDRSVPHFFFRAHNNFVAAHLLPAKSRPYIW